MQEPITQRGSGSVGDPVKRWQYLEGHATKTSSKIRCAEKAAKSGSKMLNKCKAGMTVAHRGRVGKAGFKGWNRELSSGKAETEMYRRHLRG